MGIITRTICNETTVSCSYDTQLKLNMIKLKASKKNMDETLRMLIKQAKRGNKQK